LGHRNLSDPAPAAGTQHHTARVDGNALEPRVETIDLSQPGKLPPGRHECHLRRIGGVGFVAEYCQAESVHGVHPASHERFEGGRISITGKFDE
jgi:hypothetical protein